MNTTTYLRCLVRESHRRQFAGEDFQLVAIEIASRHGITYDDDAYTDLQSEPKEGCDCGFYSTAPWRD